MNSTRQCKLCHMWIWGLWIGALLLLDTSAQATTSVVDLRCEYQTAPLDIDSTTPHLSWRIESDAAGIMQAAYQILVASSASRLASDNGDLWDSGKVESGQSQLVPYEGKALQSNLQCHWKVRVWSESGEASEWSAPALWKMGLLESLDWSCQWIGPPTLIEGDINDAEAGIPRSRLAAHQFRKDFSHPQKPDLALVTIHSPAYFELYVNGSKVGADVLTPAVSDLDQRSFAIRYDVTHLLVAGRNTIGLWSGIGWAEAITLRAQLDAVVGGKPLTLGTDGSWKTRPSGYYKIGERKWNNYGGELIDARELLPAWCDPEFDPASWESARVMEPFPGTVLSQPCPKNVVGKEWMPSSVRKIGHQTYEVDFGTCLSGWFRLAMRGLSEGTIVTMTFADAKYSSPQEKTIAIGDAYYQHFNQISQYIAAGKGAEVFEHKFNYAGFRYVLIEGLETAPKPEDMRAMLIESDLAPAGSFECSNQLFNQIHRVNSWTQRCLNLGGYYVDCPTRERWGYGDGQVATEGFMSNFRADGFYRKWLGDWRTGQQADGRLKNTAPWGSGGGGPGWGGALSAITWRHYLYYGDRRVLEENYHSIRRYVEWLEGHCKDDVLRVYGGKWSFIGDWVPPRRGMDTNNWPDVTMRELFNNCYRIIQMDILRKMAAILSKAEDHEYYGRRLAEIRPRIHEAFYDPEKQHYVSDEQAYYVMPLLAGVTPESEQPKLLSKLETNILGKNQGHLDTGMLGTYFMMEYLRLVGRSDLVFNMFNQKEYPGWGHMLEQGATTLWEQWNGHWSRIHSCFTSPSNWFYQGLAGISPDPEAPGFKNVVIKPSVVGDISWVTAHHDSPYGRIVSNWKRDGAELTMEVTIPPNSTATVHVPANGPELITLNGAPLTQVKQARYLKIQDGYTVLQLASGRFRIFSRTAFASQNGNDPSVSRKILR